MAGLKAQQIYLPTGYESLGKQADTKRRLAQRMLDAGMTPQANQQSILQVLGQLAQTWAGKRLEGKADELEVQASQRMNEDYRGRYGAFQTDAKSMSPDQLIEKYGTDPFLQDALEPYRGAFGTKLKDDQQTGYWDGRTWGTKGNMQIGSAKPNNPNDKVIYGPNGEWLSNPAAITASIAAQGIPVENGVYSMSDPAQGPKAFPAVAQPQSQVPPMGMPEIQAMTQALGPQGTVDFIKRNGVKVKVTSPQEAMQLPAGTPILLPDGTEGTVP